MNGRTEVVGKPSSEWYAWAMCSPASFETAYVQRASPTEPIVVTWASCTLKACWPNTSLVEKSTSRSSVSLRPQRGLEDVVGPDHVDPHRADGALENRVHAGDAGAVDDMRRARENLREPIRVEHVALHEAEVRMVPERRAAERVAVQVVDRDDLVLVDEAPRERRADEARAARDDDPLTRQSHAGESTSRPISARSAAAIRRRRSRRAP